MKLGLWLGAFVAAVMVSAAPQASAGEAFCNGFEAGWKSVFENRNMIPKITPLCPLPPLGKDTFQGGYEIGLLRALQSIQR